MLRSLQHDAVLSGARFISIGGRCTRGGFSQSLGKHPQVKQGTMEGVPRRIPGTTKVTYTNKKGRTFTFSVPVAEITHPQVNLTNAAGGWREMDTSFSDVGDIEDDMPSPIDDYLHQKQDGYSVRELRDAFASFCKEYVLMDTSGMKNMPTYGELNVGPDYEHYDRRLKRRRHWLTIRHRFEDTRYILWPDEDANGVGELSSGNGAELSVRDMLDTLLWLEAASTFCVRKVHPVDIMNKEEFSPLDLHREVAIMARRAQRDSTLLNLPPEELELFVACAALCVNHNVPFSLFFRSGNSGDDSDGTSGSDGACILTNVPLVHTALGAIRIMSVLDSVSNAYGFSNVSGMVKRRDVLQGLSRIMSLEAFGGKDALENVGEDELCIIMRFCVRIKEQNSAFFSHDVSVDDGDDVGSDNEEMSFRVKYKQLSHIALARCRYLLYRLDGPRTRVMSEGGYVPLVDLQQHTERRSKETLVHYNLGIRSAQGLRRVMLGAQSSAQLAELVDRLEASSVPASGNTLLVDLVQHLSHKTSASKISLTMKEVNTVLPLLARMKRESHTKELDSRFERLFSAMETAIGTAMQQDRSVEELMHLTEGLAACGFLPSSFKQVEMVLLRRIMTQSCSISEVTRILMALSSLLNGEVSQVLLQTAASHVTNWIKSVKDGFIELDQLVELLEALESCRYAALPGLVVLCREECFANGVSSLSLRRQCGYASLLASAASRIQDEDETILHQLMEDSRHYFIEYASKTKEEDISSFVNCITGMAAVGFGNIVEHEDIQSALVTFLHSKCLTVEKCATMSAITLATVLEGILQWCDTLRVVPVDVAMPIEESLLLKFRSSRDGRGLASDSLEELAESACRVVGLQHASEDLRKVSARVLGEAILHLEAVIDELKPTQQQGRSFEVVALVSAERKNDHSSTVLRYCAALERSGMSHYAEALMSRH